MEVQKIQNNNGISFNGKQTFLNRAKNAGDKITRYYWESLHYEAKSRLHYQKYNNAAKELGNEGDIKSLSSIKKVLKIAFHKLKSVTFESKSYGKFPNRFAEPDNYNAIEYRFYKIKNI